MQRFNNFENRKIFVYLHPFYFISDTDMSSCLLPMMKDGLTALMLAAPILEPRNVSLLLEMGAEVDAPDNVSYCSVLWLRLLFANSTLRTFNSRYARIIYMYILHGKVEAVAAVPAA